MKYIDSSTLELLACLSSEKVFELRQIFLDFYAEAAYQIEHFVDVDQTLEFLKVLNISEALNRSRNRQTLHRLLVRFSDLTSTGSERISIENEWEILKNETIQHDHEDVDVFWSDLSKNERFQGLAKFMLKLCTLPVSTAEVERVFSQVKLNKTDHRNRLAIDTLGSLLYIKSCKKWLHKDVSKCLVEAYKSADLYENSA